jgi:hypothetical protein
MARRAFFSFHYKPDCTRASLVRNIGALEGDAPVSDNDWESVTKGGAAAIEKWINGQMSGKSVVVVLIGTNTAGRKWINYEILKAWNDKKGVVGIHIHNLKDLSGSQCAKGANPFSGFTVDGTTDMSSIAKAYDPPFSESKNVYAHISDNIAAWADEAVTIRGKYA